MEIRRAEKRQETVRFGDLKSWGAFEHQDTLYLKSGSCEARQVEDGVSAPFTRNIQVLPVAGYFQELGADRAESEKERDDAREELEAVSKERDKLLELVERSSKAVPVGKHNRIVSELGEEIATLRDRLRESARDEKRTDNPKEWVSTRRSGYDRTE